MQISDDTYEEIESLSSEGNALADEGKYREAAKKFIQALELVPKPIEQWDECTWLLTAIGDMNYLHGSYEYSKNALLDAMHCPGGIGNPFIYLRLGQSQFELGNMESAADELARAYMGAGKEIFDSEDSKYFEFLKTVLKPPANGEW